MSELSTLSLDALREKLDQVKGYLHVDSLILRAEELEAQAAAGDFWNDAAAAAKVLAELNRAKKTISELSDCESHLADAETALELGAEDESEDFALEAERLMQLVEDKLNELEISALFTNDLDFGDAIINISPGAGGLEAQDWCEMLFKMYLKYAERRGWSTTVHDAPAGDVIGLDHATFTVKGERAYGLLKAEIGVHRLVRISPTDAQKRRQTTFAAVEVLPLLPEDIQVDIDPSDLRIDVYHASGHGGQGVNTTDSAVRITHLPTGIVVTCQNERSQLQNKAFAMEILRSRLYEREKEKRAAELEELRGPKMENGWGSQIRSYVLYPYQQIKDLRCGHTTGNVDAVLSDGDLDPFIYAYLRFCVEESNAKA